MIHLGNAAAGQFCWVDLAAADADRAKVFYRQLFGWTSEELMANGGHFTRLRLSDRDVGSIYQLRQAHLDQGVRSHWTPYVRVNDVDAIVTQVTAMGGAEIVRPFVVSDIARIALIVDPVGAHVGLWQPMAANTEEKANGEKGKIRTSSGPRHSAHIRRETQ